MTERQWAAFAAFRESYRTLCQTWNEHSAELIPLQKAACATDTPEYPVETAVVYNSAYDEVTPADEIYRLVIGDNPGKEEQRAHNRRYLVGQSGRVAEGFFRRTPELRTDFRKNVIIMNKTPVHTAKTAHLRYLQKNGSQAVRDVILESQRTMARMTAALHQSLVVARAEGSPVPELWLVGYAELKGKGVFIPYRDELRQAYCGAGQGDAAAAWDAVYVYQHFSMNRFLIDLNAFRESHTELTVQEALAQLGHRHRDEIFG